MPHQMEQIRRNQSVTQKRQRQRSPRNRELHGDERKGERDEADRGD